MNIILSVKNNLDKYVSKKNLLNYEIGTPQIAISKKVDFFEEKTSNIYFFGKIYNIENLKKELGNTENIAELVFKLYLKQSYNGFKLLDGEFTFIINHNNKIIVCRDRHGANEQIYFTKDYLTSTQSLFNIINNFNLEPNFNNLALFLKIGYIPAPQTALKNVFKLPAGNVLIFTNNNFEIIDLFGYTDFKSTQNSKITEQEATNEFERLHKNAIKDRIKGNENVQLLLSGGYDSGGNIAGLRDVFQGKTSTYSIGFKNNPWSELPLAKLMSQVYNTEHFEYEIDGSEIEYLPEIVSHFGDPFNESGMMVNFTAMKLVTQKNGKGVILGGDGNDQHFGSAGRELALNFKYRKNGLFLLQKFVNIFSELNFFDNDNKLFKARFHNEKILNILKSDSFGFRESEILKMLNLNINISKPEYLNQLPKNINSFDEFYMVHNYFSDIKQVINEIILFKASKLATQFNNQLTFPYMSTEIYNFLKTLPRNLKLKGSINDCSLGNGKSKFLHKNYLYNKLPKEITERKKQGGFAPLPIFFNNTNKFNEISKIILDSPLTKKHLNRSSVELLLNNYLLQKDKNSYWFWYKQINAFKIFNLLVLVVWWEIIIENRKLKTLSEI